MSDLRNSGQWTKDETCHVPLSMGEDQLWAAKNGLPPAVSDDRVRRARNSSSRM